MNIGRLEIIWHEKPEVDDDILRIETKLLRMNEKLEGLRTISIELENRNLNDVADLKIKIEKQEKAITMLSTILKKLTNGN